MLIIILRFAIFFTLTQVFLLLSRSLSLSLCSLLEWQNLLDNKFFTFCYFIQGLVFCLGLGDPFVFKCLSVPFSRADSGLSMYHLTAWSNFNLLKISSGSPLPPSRVNTCIAFVQIFCLRLLCD